VGGFVGKPKEIYGRKKKNREEKTKREGKTSSVRKGMNYMIGVIT